MGDEKGGGRGPDEGGAMRTVGVYDRPARGKSKLPLAAALLLALGGVAALLFALVSS